MVDKPHIDPLIVVDAYILFRGTMNYQPSLLAPVRHFWLSLIERDPERPHYSEWGFRLKLYRAKQRERKYRPKSPDAGYSYLLDREWAEVLARAKLTCIQREVLNRRRRGQTFDSIGRERGNTKQAAQRVHSQALRHIEEARAEYAFTGLAEVYRQEVRRR
jgi:hypothetical protein